MDENLKWIYFYWKNQDDNNRRSKMNIMMIFLKNWLDDSSINHIRLDDLFELLEYEDEFVNWLKKKLNNTKFTKCNYQPFLEKKNKMTKELSKQYLDLKIIDDNILKIGKSHDKMFNLNYLSSDEKDDLIKELVLELKNKNRINSSKKLKNTSNKQNKGK